MTRRSSNFAPPSGRGARLLKGSPPGAAISPATQCDPLQPIRITRIHCTEFSRVAPAPSFREEVEPPLVLRISGCGSQNTDLVWCGSGVELLATYSNSPAHVLEIPIRVPPSPRFLTGTTAVASAPQFLGTSTKAAQGFFRGVECSSMFADLKTLSTVAIDAHWC